MKDLDKIRKAIIQLQHDGHNSLDRVSSMLVSLDKWNKETSGWEKSNNLKIPNLSIPYISAEYIRTHNEIMRNVLNSMYEITKELKDESK